MRYALITGAYGGMGRAVTCALRRMGYFVFALDRNVGEREENLLPIAVDLTEEESVATAYSAVCSVTDRLDAILHFAGIYMLDSLVEIESAAFDKILRADLYSAFFVNKTFLPLMKSGTKVLMTTSELAPLDPLPFTGLYAVTKAALDKYAYALCMELQLLGISVSVLRAGAVKTGMLGASVAALDAFCEKTVHYRTGARRFHDVVDRVEAKSVPPEAVAKKVAKILAKKHPAFAYSINRNPALRLLSLLPKRWQCRIVRKILEK